GDHRDLHSFPTRRSSDLRLGGTGLVDGEYRLSVDHLADDYYVKSMSFGGIDLLREPLRISGAPSAEIAIVLAAGTSVAGNVQDEDRKSTRLNSSHVAISY